MRGVGAIAIGATVIACGALEGAPGPAAGGSDAGSTADVSPLPDGGTSPRIACSSAPIFEDHFTQTVVGGTWGDTAGLTSKLTVDPNHGATANGALLVPMAPSGAATLRQALAAGTRCVHVSFAVDVEAYSTKNLGDGATFLTINFDPDGNDRFVVVLFKDRSIHLAEQNVADDQWVDHKSIVAPPAGQWLTIDVGYDADAKTVSFAGHVDAAALPHAAPVSVWLGEIFAPDDATGSYYLDDFELF